MIGIKRLQSLTRLASSNYEWPHNPEPPDPNHPTHGQGFGELPFGVGIAALGTHTKRCADCVVPE